ASGFVTLGCVFMQRPPMTGPAPGPGAGAEPVALEGQPAPGNPGANLDRSPNPSPREAAPPAKMIPTTVEVRSDCSKTVPVFYGDGKPGFSSGRKSSISSNSISSEGRKHDGTLTIWLIDDHENGLSN